MSPEETAAISSKLDKVFGVLRDVQVDIAIIKTEQNAHTQQHEEYQRTRHDTCPNAGTVRQLRSDVDAVAGIQRSQDSRLVKVERFVAESQQAEMVEEAEQGIMLKPLKWLWTNGEKVGIAVLIAVVLSKL